MQCLNAKYSHRVALRVCKCVCVWGKQTIKVNTTYADTDRQTVGQPAGQTHTHTRTWTTAACEEWKSRLTAWRRRRARGRDPRAVCVMACGGERERARVMGAQQGSTQQQEVVWREGRGTRLSCGRLNAQHAVYQQVEGGIHHARAVQHAARPQLNSVSGLSHGRHTNNNVQRRGERPRARGTAAVPE